MLSVSFFPVNVCLYLQMQHSKICPVLSAQPLLDHHLVLWDQLLHRFHESCPHSVLVSGNTSCKNGFPLWKHGQSADPHVHFLANTSTQTMGPRPAAAAAAATPAVRTVPQYKYAAGVRNPQQHLNAQPQVTMQQVGLRVLPERTGLGCS